jgi:hypothetical protein
MPNPVGGKGVATRRRMIRLPLWMDEFLIEEALRRESDPSKLVRDAIRARFFSPVKGSTVPEDGNAVTEVATRWEYGSRRW